MKKYIVPSIQVVNLNAESLIATSFTVSSEGSNKTNMLSNKRSASDAIWGFDDEAQ